MLVNPSYCRSCVETWNSPELLYDYVIFGLDLILYSIYSFIWNLFDYSAGSVPITKVEEDEQYYRDDRGRFGKECKLTKTLNHMMNDSKGLPVSV